VNDVSSSLYDEKKILKVVDELRSSDRLSED
jgi:hypothetical protein